MHKTKPTIDNNILTEGQKKELSKIIDLIVEERLQQKYNEFVHRYTKMIVESSAEHIVKRCKDIMCEDVNEQIKNIEHKTKKVVKSVLVEASNKIRNTKEDCKLIVEDIIEKTPKLIEAKVKKQTELLAEEAVKSIEETERIKNLFQDITKGLEQTGYVINEDVDGKVKKANKELQTMKIYMEQLEKKNRILELTEGFTPIQSNKIKELLESCQTAEDVEKKFKTVKNKVLTETKKYIEKEITQLNEEKDPIDELISASTAFIKRGDN